MFWAVRPPEVQTLTITYEKTYAIVMETLTASDARARLYRLIDEVAESHRPIRITGKRNSAVLLSADDWSAIQETLFLLSVPGMRESIREGLETPIEDCVEDLDW